MQCRDIREMADSYLGEELLVETNHEILRHLETCPDCRADLDARRARRASLRRAFADAHELDPSPEFVAQLRTRLRAATAGAPVRRDPMFRGWWALAATVLLAAALAVVFRGHGPVTTSALAQAAVGDHRNCAIHFQLAEKPISLEEAARRYDPAYRVLEELPPSDVMTAAGPAHVLERHSCVYKGRRFAHIVLQFRGTLVSLLATDVDGSSQTALPREALTHVTSDGRIDDVCVVSFRATRHMVFFAGDLKQADLLRLADAVSGPLSQRLAGA